MGNVTSDGLSYSVIRQKLSVKNSREALSIITAVDMLVIVPSIAIFLALNFIELTRFGPLFLVTVLAFLLYLPVGILWAPSLLSRKLTDSSIGSAKSEVLPIILYLLLTFSMLGIYIPSIQKLTVLMPSFGSLNVVGFAIVVINISFVMKNLAGIMKE
ncbi:MAG: hypothetical protein M0Z77_03155 [Thermoplasmatales archaeon]|nr:hypothetical protein [Candidatus Thermoplasmatota archaeon]MCL6002062.1 hypothetical protein [Candidatus Thermoplasmatota archaeon]MDA8054635.1 hypothetical protein [Thermoplasmatales archaeon]